MFHCTAFSTNLALHSTGGQYLEISKILDSSNCKYILQNIAVFSFVFEEVEGAACNKAHPLRLLQRFKHKKFRGRGSFVSLFNVQKGEPPIRRALLALWDDSIISRWRGFRALRVRSPCRSTPGRCLNGLFLSQTLLFFFCNRFRAKKKFVGYADLAQGLVNAVAAASTATNPGSAPAALAATQAVTPTNAALPPATVRKANRVLPQDVDWASLPLPNQVSTVTPSPPSRRCARLT